MRIIDIAIRLGWTVPMVRRAIQLGKVEFAIAIKSANGRRYKYLIYEDIFERYYAKNRK